MKYSFIERIRSAIYEFVKPPKTIRPVFLQRHIYFFITGGIATVNNVVEVTIFPTGCKGLLDNKGGFHIIPPWWNQCEVVYADPTRRMEKLSNGTCQ